MEEKAFNKTMEPTPSLAKTARSARLIVKPLGGFSLKSLWNAAQRMG